MRVGSRCRLEGHGAERTFVEDLTVTILDVGLQNGNISKDHATVDTTGEENKNLDKTQLTLTSSFYKMINLNKIVCLKHKSIFAQIIEIK